MIKKIHKKNKKKNIHNIIHLGANKTGTTSFQINLFSKKKEIGYLGQHCKESKKILNELRNLKKQDQFYYNENFLKKKINKIKKKKIVTFLYSDEDIITSNNISRSAQRLKSLLPQAKVVLTIRNQLSALESWYLSHGQFLKMVPKKYFGKSVNFNEWLNYCFKFKDSFVTPEQASPFEAMDYNKIIEIFAKYFGFKNIKILLYEDLKLNQNKAFYEWSKLLKISEEKIKYSIENNKIHRKSPKKTVELIDKKKLKLIKNFFAKGNHSLSKKYKLNLKVHKYPL